MEQSPSKSTTEINKEFIKKFLEEVRSGNHPENAAMYLADKVKAHQVHSEAPVTVDRTPQNYTEHIHDFLKMHGRFTFEITELLAEGDKVYARWIQYGKHLAEINGYVPTGKPLVEIASCVYRLKEGKIIEYWMQIDRLGMEKQLQQNI